MGWQEKDEICPIYDKHPTERTNNDIYTTTLIDGEPHDKK
jgi:hypothetical protein